MRQKLRLFGVSLLLLTLSACGFKPLYGTQDGGPQTAGANSTVAEMAQVRILPLADRPGQMLHNDLRNELNPSRQSYTPKYDLRVSLSETKQELAIRQDETATRANLRLQANFSLFKHGSQERVFSGSSLSIVSYDIVDSEYATYPAEKNARKRGINELAENIRLRLASHFSRNSQTSVLPGHAGLLLARRP